jgi:hypothetical protein
MDTKDLAGDVEYMLMECLWVVVTMKKLGCAFVFRTDNEEIVNITGNAHPCCLYHSLYRQAIGV